MEGKVLIVEDEAEIAELIRIYLDKEGLSPFWAGTAEMAEDLVHKESFDLVLLDINLPGMDGFEFLGRLRKEEKMPVIIVSAREADEDTILGLGLGADDYVSKPFSPKLLMARVRAQLRRASEFNIKTRKLYRFGDFVLEPETFFLEKNGERITLASREFDLLLFLVETAGESSSPQALYERIWQNNYGEIATVGVHIQRLRKKLENNPSQPEFIKTIHGFGYSFNPDLLVSEGFE